MYMHMQYETVQRKYCKGVSPGWKNAVYGQYVQLLLFNSNNMLVVNFLKNKLVNTTRSEKQLSAMCQLSTMRQIC